MDVQLLSFDRCPNWQETDRLDFHGSPTVLEGEIENCQIRLADRMVTWSGRIPAADAELIDVIGEFDSRGQAQAAFGRRWCRSSTR